jgi:hypothetical protein
MQVIAGDKAHAKRKNMFGDSGSGAVIMSSSDVGLTAGNELLSKITRCTDGTTSRRHLRHEDFDAVRHFC